jgi:hypothetical protein
MTRDDVRRALVGACDRMRLEMYELVDLMLARCSRFIPERVYRRLERRISRRQMELLRLPPTWSPKRPTASNRRTSSTSSWPTSPQTRSGSGAAPKPSCTSSPPAAARLTTPGSTTSCYRRLRTIQRLNVH